MVDLTNQLVVAISSRALFDLNESNAIFEKSGIEAYANYQVEHEDDVLAPGIAFKLVEKLLKINKQTKFIEVILISRNSADTGLRVFNSIQAYDLDITRAAFTNGKPTQGYLSAYGADLFLSAHAEDVRHALQAGHAAAHLLPRRVDSNASSDDEVRIAFDGDAVLFSDEAEAVYQAEGLEAFCESERQSAHSPLPGGPFKAFLSSLHGIQQQFPMDECPIRTALITARSAPTHERVIRTLRAWNIRIDEALFLGGLSKAEFLKAFGADIFFDDQRQHCESAAEHVASGHVPHGVVNK